MSHEQCVSRELLSTTEYKRARALSGLVNGVKIRRIRGSEEKYPKKTGIKDRVPTGMVYVQLKGPRIEDLGFFRTVMGRDQGN